MRHKADFFSFTNNNYGTDIVRKMLQPHMLDFYGGICVTPQAIHTEFLPQAILAGQQARRKKVSTDTPGPLIVQQESPIQVCVGGGRV